MLDILLRYSPLISAAATLLGLLSLYLIYRQLKDSKSWNKLHFTYTFSPDSSALEEFEIFLDERLNLWNRDNPLTELEVKALIGKEHISPEDTEKLCQTFDASVKKKTA
ncbi:hypothetical protein ABS648_07440 [Pseudomonas solani]|uniref:Uncharacterized protein n=1 Tax=Pseudomonas solani TaxID=2731552 RepID=A0AAU7Y5X5_9PSED